MDVDRIVHARVRLRPHVAHRDFPTESIFLNLDAGRYHGLNTVAADMVQCLQKDITVGDAATDLAKEYDEPVERVLSDLVALISDLVERDLAEVEYPG